MAMAKGKGEPSAEDGPEGLYSILEEMKDYYDQRASEYPDWSNQKEMDDDGSEEGSPWLDDVQVFLHALSKNRVVGSVLEVASGTGILTGELVKNASSVTALDSSQGMIEECKARMKGNTKVRYVLADFFDWTPDKTYDAVAFSFWISHVPNAKLNEFVSKVSLCLKPKGKVFFVDQQRGAMKRETFSRPGGEVAMRRLDDGRDFKIIKHFYSSKEIEECFLRNQIKVRVTNTPTHFYFGVGEKLPQSPSSSSDTTDQFPANPSTP
jgi:ubiquinone/menaquinone biosynthesis C-methylase UbiE